ncbi:hypothetical protein BKA70DRAFT_1427024 [Coprinopsis sp. MPI-PUGE-AT-0042]|nr:hypothetical protein BKA70DRAFT_1427024 [Coprinopsis sp. MPI-PUGE-AT-0042]
MDLSLHLQRLLETLRRALCCRRNSKTLFSWESHLCAAWQGKAAVIGLADHDEGLDCKQAKHPWTNARFFVCCSQWDHDNPKTIPQLEEDEEEAWEGGESRWRWVLEVQKARFVAQMVPVRQGADEGSEDVPKESVSATVSSSPQALGLARLDNNADSFNSCSSLAGWTVATRMEWDTRSPMGAWAHFNDSSSLVLRADKEHLTTSPLDGMGRYTTEVQGAFSQTFERNIMERLYGEHDYMFEDTEPAKGTEYLRIKHVIAVKFSRDVFQFNFYDHSKFILSLQTACPSSTLTSHSEVGGQVCKEVLISKCWGCEDGDGTAAAPEPVKASNAREGVREGKEKERERPPPRDQVLNQRTSRMALR